MLDVLFGLGLSLCWSFEFPSWFALGLLIGDHKMNVIKWRWMTCIAKGFLSSSKNESGNKKINGDSVFICYVGDCSIWPANYYWNNDHR